MAFRESLLVFSSLIVYELAQGNVRSICTPKIDIKASRHYIVEPGAKYLISATPMNWYAAMTFCNQACTQMLSMDTPTAGSDLIRYLNTYSHKSKMIWLSGNKLADLKIFTWGFDGSHISYSNWKAKQPDNAGNKQHCMIVTPSIFQWDDEDCYRGNVFAVCKL